MSARGSRQGFLGGDAEEIFRKVRIGIVGLGGGGSHIVQQLAHVGVRNFTLFDPDVVEESNLNRLIGGTEDDAAASRKKIDVATRLIRGLCRDAIVHAIDKPWELEPERLRSCDLVFCCLDSFAARRDLEAATRRYLIPLIDIGLDVTAGEPPQMAGQVILSMPGRHCMQCLGFLSEENLQKEAAKYGNVGVRPQVVWGNGALASAAVGLGVDVLTNWTRLNRETVYLSFDGNLLEVRPHVRLRFPPEGECSHYPPGEVGDPIMQKL